MPLYTGQVYRVQATFYSDTATTNAANPTTVTFKYRIDRGDPTSYTGAIDTDDAYTGDSDIIYSSDSVGVFYVDLPLSTAGDYDATWAGTGAVATSTQTQFTVLALLTDT